MALRLESLETTSLRSKRDYCLQVLKTMFFFLERKWDSRPRAKHLVWKYVGIQKISFRSLNMLWTWMNRIRLMLINKGTNPIKELIGSVKAVIAMRRKNKESGRPDLLQLMIDAEIGDLSKVTSDDLTAKDDTEVDVKEKKRELDYYSVNKLQYLDQVLQESLRIYPPVYLFVSRECGEDIDLGKIKMKKVMGIQVPSYHLHRDPELWGPDANEFKPESRIWWSRRETKGEILSLVTFIKTSYDALFTRHCAQFREAPVKTTICIQKGKL
ncbi:cytochrome P450 3A28 [Caerostris extrusa]|uniref:Cytochrome P450 3A28 n=1 Tax=Caerostris extrusa TaxID=172846 RepID=A0AAV4N088_CAEEX|nr:cytochrome P450 3A28 [Caerostris extrusa]